VRVFYPVQLIIGKSGSGKSSLAKAIARDKLTRALAVGVYDPLRYEDWPHTFQTHERSKYCDWVLRNYHLRKFLVIDESGAAVGKFDWFFDWICTTGRHLGCAHTTFVCHKLEQLSRLVQGQTDVKWIFRTDVKDARQLADMHGEPELVGASQLPRFHFYRIAPFVPLITGRIFLRRGLPHVEFLK
jgi:hypothetical protein